MNPMMLAVVLVGDGIDELLVGLALDVPVITLIAGLSYRRARSRANNVFTLVVINMVVFFVTHVMVVASVGVGVGFGLFALFGILRFRTGTLPVVEMTFLFAAIAIAALNAIAPIAMGLVEAVIANVTIFVLLEVMGGWWLQRQLQTHNILYERVELLHPARRTELIADLEGRTGLVVEGVVVNGINFLNDTAKLTVRVRPVPEENFMLLAEFDDAAEA
jgi:prepilin signal peptidase PulO-like enzyme (type II secretory pathway)